MTESEAMEIVERYEALLEAVMDAEEYRQAQRNRDIVRLIATETGVAVEWISLEDDGEGGAYLDRWPKKVEPSDLAQVSLEWMDEVSRTTVWPLTPENLRRPRDARGRFLRDWPD